MVSWIEALVDVEIIWKIVIWLFFYVNIIFLCLALAVVRLCVIFLRTSELTNTAVRARLWMLLRVIRTCFMTSSYWWFLLIALTHQLLRPDFLWLIIRWWRGWTWIFLVDKLLVMIDLMLNLLYFPIIYPILLFKLLYMLGVALYLSDEHILIDWTFFLDYFSGFYAICLLLME